MGTIYSCAPVTPKPISMKPKVIPSDHEAPEKKEDVVQKVYTDFIMASIHMAHGRYEKARDYLSEVIKNDPDSIHLNKKMAVLLENMKDFKGAAEYAQKCIDLEPNNISTRMLLAEIYSVAGDEESAVNEYHKILQIDPNHQRIRLLLTTILIRKGQLRPALKHLDIIIQKDPDMVIAHYYRGRIHLELKNYAEAEKAYLDTLRLKRDMEPALFDLGSLYQMRKEYQDAAETYERLLGFNPTKIIVRERLIHIYHKLGQNEKVEKQIEEIKEQTKPGDPRRQTLGLIYLQHGKLDESIKELDLIVSAWPENHMSRYYLASAYLEKGELENALKHFKLIKEGSKYFINSQMHIAYILDTQERFDEAIEVLRKALDADNKKIEIYQMLASIFQSKKEYGKAKDVIEDGLKQDDKNVELIYRLGIVLDISGEKEMSLQQMKRVLEIDPNHADALNYIGYSYAERGIRLNEAKVLIEKALKIKPDSGYIVDSLGWVYYQKGLYDKALDSLEKAVSLTPNDPAITEHLGDVYFKKREYRKALEMYQKALALKHPQEEKIKEKIDEVKKLLK